MTAVCDCGSAKLKESQRCNACEIARKKVARITRQTKICIGCGSVFVKSKCGKTKGLYCTRACAFADPKWHEDRHARNRQRLGLTVDVIRLRDEAAARKRLAWRVAACVWCGASYTRQHYSQTTCSHACKLARLASIRAEEAKQLPVNVTPRLCGICGASFLKPFRKPGTYRYCSGTCRAVADRQAMRRTRQHTGRKMSDRARHADVPYERGIGPISVCTRDKWTCQLCGVKTPRRLRGTYHDHAPEVDHIIPLSASGSPGHVWSNVQCACRKCNGAKSRRVLGQFRLTLMESV
jgi:5-methylcytosine-specific restriction endonuclease McrA